MSFYKTIIFCSTILLWSCNTDQKNVIDEAFSNASFAKKYLTDYSPQYISVKDGIVLKFKSEYSNGIENSNVKGVKIKPHVDGTFSWINGNSLSFRPDEVLAYDKKYEMIMQLGELLEDSELPHEPFIWSFETKKLQLNIQLHGVKIDIENGKEQMKMLGQINSSDYIDPTRIEELLKTQHLEDQLEVNWVHTNHGKSHNFTISGIKQLEDKESLLQINWNGTAYDNDFKGSDEITISPKGFFELTDIKLSQSPQRIIELYFTRPVDQNQNLKGLISINQHTAHLKTEVDGNVIYIYPTEELHDSFAFYVSDKLKNIDGKNLGTETLADLRFELVHPGVRKIGVGTILPNSHEAILPFEAINLEAVDIEIFKIYNNNILQYLQENNINNGGYLNQVGRIVHREKILLKDLSDSANQNNWQRYGLDLKNYIKNDPAALYQVRIGFKKSYAISDCSNSTNNDEVVLDYSGEESLMNYSDNYYYDYEGRDNPCNLSYYNPDRFISRNLMLSDVAVIVKKGTKNNYHFALSHIGSAFPLANARVKLYDFQQQLIEESISSSDGLLSISADNNASFAIVSDPSGYAYVKLDDYNANSLTDFDISGVKAAEGVDGFIYMDRGVYRPGDTVHLNFMLDESEQQLPNMHPVTLQVYDPKGNEGYSESTNEHLGRIYSFDISTDQQSLTGGWRASITVGSQSFSKGIRIEAIKPNRLKIELDNPAELKYFDKSQRSFSVDSRWLHGSPASGLRATIDAQLHNIEPNFTSFDDYVFMDPAKEGNIGIIKLYDSQLDENGHSNVNISLNTNALPGKARANVKTRVFEKSGNFSENYSTLYISPFDTYVGVRSPKNRWGYKSVKIGDNATFNINTVSDDGEKRGNRRLSIGVYDIQWQWWYYEGNRHNIYRLNSNEHREAFYSDFVRTDADGNYELNIDFQDVEYGRKMIRVCDLESGHCSGDFFYAQGWGRAPEEEQRESLAKLIFSSDKTNYSVGEEVVVRIPSEKGSRILMSMETGDDVLYQEWIEGSEGETKYAFQTSSQMAPNIYLHAIMVQSYNAKSNDLPIRMYGILPINILDEETIIKPSIIAPESVEPKEAFSLTVGESQGRSMAYTIAIVDEGLLDLTNFTTPDPHRHFYAKQSLGVKTWDLYQHVLTGFSGEVDRIISVGGDSEGKEQATNKNAIRFKPAVLTTGPFHLSEGETKEHEFVMPNYIGSVRAMVVAKSGNAYGYDEENVTVKKPIMLLPTMPRVLGPSEEVQIPISIFAMDQNIRKVQVSIETNDQLSIIGNRSQTVNFDMPGEKMAFFTAKVGKELGIAKVKFTASGGQHQIDQELEIDIRNPNAFESTVYNHIIEPGDTLTTAYEIVGMNGTNEGMLELSTIPPMNLNGRLDYLTRYPYGCIEQTISAAFPQLALEDIIEIDFSKKKEIEKNIQSAIRRIAKMQLTNGGFSYWPGGQKASDWGSTYAGHFFIEAKNYGYHVSENLMQNWHDFQVNKAKGFTIDSNRNQWHQNRQMIDQAYRLYALALYGDPSLTAMNVLRQESNLPNVAKYMLAAAYAYAGKNETATQLIRNTAIDIKPYQELAFTYGSDLRDMALIAQCLMKLDRKNEAGLIVKRIADKLNGKSWYSTQTLAQSFIAISKFISEFEQDDMNFSWQFGDAKGQSVQTKSPIYLYSFDPEDLSNTSVQITNHSSNALFASMTIRGQKSPEEVLDAKAVNKNITMAVQYEDLLGKTIDPTELIRGTDFIAHVTIKNQNSRGGILEEIALSQIFPSGWEIQSGGLSNVSYALREDSYDYRDVRDDRVYTFFDLEKRKDFRILLTATYDGEYYLPSVSCEAMYDHSIFAKTKAKKVSVLAP